MAARRRGVRVTQGARSLLDMLLPPRCLARGCDQGGTWLCDACIALATPTPDQACPTCLEARTRGGPCVRCSVERPAIREAHAVGKHVGPLRDALIALKYRGRTCVAPRLAELMANPVRPLADRSDVIVVPVPSHPRRVRRRGVDVPRLLARSIAPLGTWEFAPDALQRVRNTPTQVGLDRASRAANVAGAFAAQGLPSGHLVLLVDDVLTTGATANACARTLQSGGCGAVVLVVLSRANNLHHR